MVSIIQHFIDRLYKPSNHSISILGLMFSGKTTLLYLLKLGKVVETIPSIGFNVETFRTPSISGRAFTMTGWDFGGCSAIRTMLPMFRVYTENEDAMIWMVDSCDWNSLQESLEVLTIIVEDWEWEFVDHVRQRRKTWKNTPILILANKQDAPNAMSINQIQTKFAKLLSGQTAAIFPCSLIQSISAGGLPQAFDWLVFAVENAKRTVQLYKQEGPPSTALTMFSVHPYSADVITQKLETWLLRAENDCSPQDFLAQFHAIDLPAWDHYSHIRIAYVILATYGRQKGKNLIFNGIEKYIQQSAQSRGRSFHVTMTYFWVQIVHFGICSMPSSSVLLSAIDTVNDDFARFLLLNPYVADGNLWTNYYSKNVMMSPKAKGEMVLPDRKPLPNLVVRDVIQAAKPSSTFMGP